MDREDLRQRREFLKGLAAAAGGVVLLPYVSACSSNGRTETAAQQAGSVAVPKPPLTKPSGWDPIAYNRIRGNAGAIPDSYLPDINGEDGVQMHLGKHLPYIVEADGAPAGYLPIMWGDPSKGYARHPNAPKSEANNYEGHWYNWIRVRKAVEGDTEELESEFAEWPAADPMKYLVLGGGDLTADSGKNTIYLVGMPDDVHSGDTVRIWAHCLTHGEYVDFLTV